MSALEKVRLSDLGAVAAFAVAVERVLDDVDHGTSWVEVDGVRRTAVCYNEAVDGIYRACRTSHEVGDAPEEERAVRWYLTRLGVLMRVPIAGKGTFYCRAS